MYDVEGCFPSMLKEHIRFAMRQILQEIKKETGCDSVMVPTRGMRQKCRLSTVDKQAGVMWRNIPFQVLLDIMDFSLDFAFTQIDGDILHQTQGIPMGDPLSLAMIRPVCISDYVLVTGCCPR